MKHFPKIALRKQTGITLVETAIALAIAAVVVSAAFAGFQANARRSETRDNSQLVSEMIADTKQLFGPTNRYSELTTEVAISSRVIPNNLHVPGAAGAASTAAINSYGGPVTIEAAVAGSNDQAKMVFGNIPQNQCADLALSVERAVNGMVIVAAGSGATTTKADSEAAGVAKVNTNNSKVSAEQVKDDCNSQATSDLVVFFTRN